MTGLEFEWWALGANHEDPEVMESIAQATRGGFHPDVDTLRKRTERALIGAVLVAGKVPEKALKVTPRHFGHPAHAAIWSEMLRHDEFDAVLLAGWVSERTGSDPMSILTVLTSMLEEFPVADLVGWYAQRVIEGRAAALLMEGQ